MSSLADFLVKKQELEDKLKLMAKEALQRDFDTFFEKFPHIEAVRWNQYYRRTYDGKTLPSMEPFQLKFDFLNSLDEHSEYVTEDWITPYDEKKKGPKTTEAFTYLHKTFLGAEDVFCTVFGDTQTVTKRQHEDFESINYTIGWIKTLTLIT